MGTMDPDPARMGRPTMPRRRPYRPLPLDLLEGRTAPSHAVHSLAHHDAAHPKPKVRHSVRVQPATEATTRAVDAGTGPVVGGTVGTGAGATLDPTSTYLAPVSAFGVQVAGNPYGGQSDAATIDAINGGVGINSGVLTGTVGSFNTLDAGNGLGTTANALVSPGLAATASLPTPLDGSATIPAGSALVP